MKTEHRFLPIAAAVALLLAACSSNSTPAANPASPAHNRSAGDGNAVPTAAPPVDDTEPSAAGSIDPCSLLTQAEVDTAVGQPLRPGKATIPNYDCAWSTSDFAADVSVTVSDWTAIKTSATTNGKATAVAGVGDEALTKGGGLLYVRKGSAGFLLMIGGPHIDSQHDEGLAAEKILATAVLGRL